MLVPAICYKEELERLFAKEIYTEDYFLYSGYRYGYELPIIKTEDRARQYAIVSGETIIGYFGYRIDPETDSIYNFGLYSFSKGNPVVGKDVFEHLEMLVNTHRRLEWRMIGCNPVKKHYDKFCLIRHNGNRVTLHDVCKDFNGNYCDEYIYEIVNYNIGG